MWTLVDNVTNKVVVPAEGIISVTKPDSVLVKAFVNDATSGVHHIHVKAGDTVYFKTENTTSTNTPIVLDYAGKSITLVVPASTQTKENKMGTSDAINLFAQPQASGLGGAMGGGLGAGLVGGLLGTMLFRNNSILGGDGAVPATLPAVESVVNNSAINTALGDIKASIPYNEAQVQLALAGAQADINSNITAGNAGILNTINTQSVTNANYIAGVNANVSNSAAMNLSATKDAAALNLAAVNTASAANLAATQAASILAERNAWALTQTITNDGDKTRALIQSIDKSNDSRTITSLANEISDLKNHANLAAATGNITISNTNTANASAQQIQAQQQQQLQYQILNQLAALNADVQSVKQSSVVFNSGRMSDSGNQSAANTRVA